MRTIFENALSGGGGVQMPERLIARTANASAERDATEVSSIPLANNDANARRTVCIELLGAQSLIEAGERWDVYLMHRMTNPNGSSNPNPIIWWNEVRLSENDGHDRDGTRLLWDARTLRITRNPDAFGGSLHHGIIWRRATIEFSDELPAISARYVKAINWCTPSGGAADPHERAFLRVLRYRPGMLA